MKIGSLRILAAMTAILVAFAVSSHSPALVAGQRMRATGEVDTALTFDTLVLASSHPEPHGNFGDSVAGVGDVNHDGAPDVIVGAWFEAAMAGRAYVFDGEGGALLFELMSPNPRAEGLFGHSVAAAGDINQDGFADVIIGAAGDGEIGAWGGRAYIFGGPSGQLLFELISPSRRASVFGHSVSGTGDVDQDGFPDVIVGDPADFGPYADAGKAYVFGGRDGRLLYELASPNATMFGHFGARVSGAGDVDQDGFADVIVGAPWEDPARTDWGGRAYVYSGRTGALLFELMSREPQDYGLFGDSVAAVDDVNGDGHSDVGVGETGTGCIYVFSGKDGMLLFQPKAPSGLGPVAGAGDVDADHVPDIVAASYWGYPATPGTKAFMFSGRDGSVLGRLVAPKPSAGIRQGFNAVARAGDINHDGFEDLILGAGGDGPPPMPAAGRAYIFISRSGQP